MGTSIGTRTVGANALLFSGQITWNYNRHHVHINIYIYMYCVYFWCEICRWRSEDRVPRDWWDEDHGLVGLGLTPSPGQWLTESLPGVTPYGVEDQRARDPHLISLLVLHLSGLNTNEPVILISSVSWNSILPPLTENLTTSEVASPVAW